LGAISISKIEERYGRETMACAPRAVWKQFFFCGEESTTERDLELLGDDCLLWASDFPHEATRTNLHDLVKEFFDRKDLPAAAKNKIAHANPKHFYAL
jgi:predicted TIM-barrel fold metal-dependent hydrolase